MLRPSERYSQGPVRHLRQILLYLGYMLIASYAFALLTGCIGFFACFTFVRIIYGAVKVE